MNILADTDNSLYLKAEMLANKSISKSFYTFWEPDLKKGLIIKSHIPNTST